MWRSLSSLLELLVASCCDGGLSSISSMLRKHPIILALPKVVCRTRHTCLGKKTSLLGNMPDSFVRYLICFRIWGITEDLNFKGPLAWGFGLLMRSQHMKGTLRFHAADGGQGAFGVLRFGALIQISALHPLAPIAYTFVSVAPTPPPPQSPPPPPPKTRNCIIQELLLFLLFSYCY